MVLSFSYDDIKQAYFPIERQFHVLKHFGEIDSQYRKYLISHSEYSDEDIVNQLKEFGSQFYKSFASDPLHLLDIVKNKFRHDSVEAKWIGDRCEVHMDFSKEHFPEGVGEDHIIHIDKLTDEKKNQLPGLEYETLQKMSFSGHPKKTWTVNLIIKKVEGNPVIITIFPGIYAPLLPNAEEQTEEEYRKSMEFWSKHVLIS
jgi:hypothetical protein